jgi:hypothetical protein
MPSIHVITIDSDTDDQRFEATIQAAVDAGLTEDLARSKITRESCVKASEWPKHLDRVDVACAAFYAAWGGKSQAIQHFIDKPAKQSWGVKGVFSTLYGDMIDKPWDQGSLYGDITQNYMSHHVPATLSHVMMVQMLKDSAAPSRIILESDTYGSMTVPFNHLPYMVQAVPEDYDILILGHGNKCMGEFVKSFTSPDGIVYDIHRWTKGYEATIAYLMSHKGAETVLDHASRFDLPMFDVYVTDVLCSKAKQTWNRGNISDDTTVVVSEDPRLKNAVCYSVIKHPEDGSCPAAS